MAATFVLLLSCLVYGAVAYPPASSYLPPGGAVGGRPAVQGPAVSVPAPAVGSGPSSSYLPPAKGALNRRPNAQAPPQGPALSTPSSQRPVAPVTPAKRVGGRPAAQASGPAISSPAVQRPVIPVAAPRPISSPVVASPRPISSGRKQGSYKSGAAAASGSRTVGTHAPY
ncbi:hypothetical protein ACLKA7_005297 [Drosophila subpalustris]